MKAIQTLWLAYGLVALSMVSAVDAEVSSQVNGLSAPPRKCEIRLSAWCIGQGAMEISDRLVQHEKYSRVWTIRGFFHPSAPLIVLEPHGCRDGLSDSVSASRFDSGYSWENKLWNRMIVRIKTDGSCDLEVLIPTYASDPSAEAYFSGLSLIKNCTNADCDGAWFIDLAGQLDSEYRKRGK